MTRTKSRRSRYAKTYPLKKEEFISNTQAKQLHTDQQKQQDIQSPPENQATTLSNLTSSVCLLVVVPQILSYGIAKDNHPLLYITCFMAIAPLGPSAQKMLFSLIREIFSLKDSKK